MKTALAICLFCFCVVGMYLLIFLIIRSEVFMKDIRFNYGKHHLRSVRKDSNAGKLARFFMWDVREYIVSWHYRLFIAFTVIGIAFMIFVSVYIILFGNTQTILGSVLFLIWIGSAFPLFFVRFRFRELFAIQSNERYRKNNRKPK